MKKIILIFIIIFSLFVIESGEYHCTEKNSSFLNIENIMLRNYSFIENGIKFEYTTNTAIDIEKEFIINKLIEDLSLQVVQAGRNISARNEILNYSITLYEEDRTRVEVILLNKDIRYKIQDLKKAVDKIKNESCIQERYFSFIKGKLSTTKEGLCKEIVNEIQDKTLQSIDISTGTISKAKLIDGSSINIGQISYNTGEYLIIGTPVIFTTY